MLMFQWNALSVGDAVIVHDDSDLTAAPERGVVKIVQTRVQPSVNDVAIRLESGGALVTPRRGAVHSAATGSEGCWRCELLAKPARRVSV